MELKTLPRPPQPVLFIKLAAPRIPHGWTPYLGKLGTATADRLRPPTHVTIRCRGAVSPT